MLSNGNAGLVQLNMSNVNGAAKNKLHEKWDTVKRKLGPLVKKSTSSPGKLFLHHRTIYSISFFPRSKIINSN